MEKIIKNSGIVKTGTIFSKSIQVLAYADDLDVITRSIDETREALCRLTEAAKQIAIFNYFIKKCAEKEKLDMLEA